MGGRRAVRTSQRNRGNMKMKYIPSTDKTEVNSNWNNFNPKIWLEFKETFPKIKFVDVIEGEDYWANEEDTVVFTINDKGIGALLFADKLSSLGVDEFDYKQIKGNKYIVRLWWD